MKFMKLGSRSDTFTTKDAFRCVSSDLSSDIIILVGETLYSLHKFPLLSKSLKLQKLFSSSALERIELKEFPGGADAFELCAKFCYRITITIGAHNIVAARCAAEYLQMSEALEKGNFIYKLEVFFASCILQGWRDSILALQTTRDFPSLSKDLRITPRCIDAVALRVFSNPSRVTLSARGWWADDVAELNADLYWRTMVAVKSSGKVPPSLLGDALKIYASRWLTVREADDSEADPANKRVVLESIVSLLPAEKGAVSSSFLLKLLKAAKILNASSSTKADLVARAGLQLQEATVSDLLIPSYSQGDNESAYDVDVVLSIIEKFKMQARSPPTSPRLKKTCERRRSRSAENIDAEFQENRRSSSASHSAKLKVAKLVDGYMRVIAKDRSLSLEKFIAVAESVPGFSRLVHDDLYAAIDVFLKTHPEMSKSERKRLCRVLECNKLSMEACMHAAQNELLPLRVVVQVLFSEQARAVSSGKAAELQSKVNALLERQDIDPSDHKLTKESHWSFNGSKSSVSTLRMKLAEDDVEEVHLRGDDVVKSNKFKQLCALPSKPKRIFSKLWSMNKVTG